MKPTFSIVIPTLNEEKFLPKLLESLTTQTVKDFEVIVVDGQSKDKTVAVAKRFAGCIPLTVVASEKLGVSYQRNKGAELSEADWLIFVDADSILMPYFIERILHFVEQKKPSVFTTWAQPDRQEGNEAIFALFLNILLEGSLLLKRPMAPGPLTAIKHDIFQNIGGYDESHTFDEDIELGLRLAKKGITIVILRESLYIWSMRRIRSEGKIKVMNQYILAAIPILLFKRTFKYMLGYSTGGQLYKRKRKPTKQLVLKQFESKLKILMKELF